MKIPLKIVKDYAGAMRIVGNLYVSSEDLRIIGIMTAIIDTGCPETIISSDDRTRIRASSIAVKRLKGEKLYITLGGSVIQVHKIDKMHVRVGKSVTMPVYISLGIVESVSIKDEGFPIPSIIGMDYLAKSKLTLVFNPSKNEAYLTDELKF